MIDPSFTALFSGVGTAAGGGDGGGDAGPFLGAVEGDLGEEGGVLGCGPCAAGVGTATTAAADVIVSVVRFLWGGW